MKKHHHTYKKLPQVSLLSNLHLTSRKKKRGMCLRDNCKLYTTQSTEQLKKYLKEKGLI